MTRNSNLWRLSLFGDLKVSRGDRSVQQFQTQKTKALLGFLALNLDRRHGREELVDLLWPDADMDSGRHRLSQALTWLRSQLEDRDHDSPVVLADRQTVGLNPESVTTDVVEFRKLLAEADMAPDAEKRMSLLSEAVDLYRGDLLANQYDDWALLERQRLLSHCLDALRRLSAHYEARQEWDAAISWMRRAVLADPLDEELHSELIRILALSGQTAAALRQFREMEQLLAAELESRPSDTTLALVQRIRHGHNQADHSDSRFSARLVPPPLPKFPTQFFGRTNELKEAHELATPGSARVITITGTGGAGKTRLAFEVASLLHDEYGGAVWFVSLAEVTDSRLLAVAIVEAMRLPYAGTSPWDAVIEALTPNPSLMVLDNVEQLVVPVRDLLRMLTHRVPTLTIVITSRQRIGIDGEYEVALAPLPVPGAMGDLSTARAGDIAISRLSGPVESQQRTTELMQCPSVQLFVNRAQAVHPSFRVTPRNARDVATLCDRLEGLPLAIELCAAWASMLTPQQMLSRLSRRFDLLVSRRADIASRHRTLRAAIEYSFVQLSPVLQRFFLDLSVFSGGWNLEAAEAILGEVKEVSALAALIELRERSLIQTVESNKEMRFRMLEMLREFAMEQLPASASMALQRSRTEYYLQLAEACEPHLSGPDQASWLAKLEEEHDNLRASLSWALEHEECEIGLRLSGALAQFWDVRGFLGEGQDWLERLLQLPGRPSPEVRAKALTMRGYLARNQGDSAAVNDAMREAVQLWRSVGDPRGLAGCLQVLATLAYSREDCDTAEALLGEALEIARSLGDVPLVARALLNLGNIALEQGEYAAAWESYSESLALYRSAGISNRVASALNNMGLVARYQGDYQAAGRLFEEALATSRELADRPTAAETLLNLGTIARLERESADAAALLTEAAMLAGDVGEKRLLAWCAKETGHLACADGDYVFGVRMLSAAQSQQAAMRISFKPTGPQEIADDLERARAVLGNTGFAAAWAAGHGLSGAQIHAEIRRMAGVS